MRVPASMKAGVQLSGASVEISPEIKLHEAQHDCSDSGTTVSGESSMKANGLTSHKANVYRGYTQVMSRGFDVNCQANHLVHHLFNERPLVVIVNKCKCGDV